MTYHSMTTDTSIDSSITTHNILSPHYKQGAERGERSEPCEAPPPKTHASITTRRHITCEVHKASRAPSEASAARLARRPTKDTRINNHKKTHDIS